MKVLYLVSGVAPPAGWGTEFVQNIIFKLSLKGVDATIITPIYSITPKNYRQWFTKMEQKYNVKFIEIHFPQILSGHITQLAFTPLFVTLKTISILSKEKFDLVHEFSSTPIILVRALLIRLFYNIPTVFTLSVYNSTILGKIWWIKVLDFAKMYFIPAKVFIKKLIKYGIVKRKIEYMPAAIDTELFSRKKRPEFASKSLALPKNKYIVSYFGTLTKEKGVDLLIYTAQMFAPNKEVVFVVYSVERGNREHKYFADLIKRLNLKNLIFRHEYTNVKKLISVSDLLVFAQKTGHGSTIPPISLIECLISGKKTLAFDNPGVSDLKVFPTLRVLKMASKRQLYDEIQKTRIEKLTNKTPRSTFELYDLENSATKYFESYEKII